jgi:hypothetical protein
MGIGQVLTMPLFFASNAIYPISMMPDWLQVVAHANPLTYEVDALRALMLADGNSTFGLAVDFAVLSTATTILVIVGARVYPSVVSLAGGRRSAFLRLSPHGAVEQCGHETAHRRTAKPILRPLRSRGNAGRASVDLRPFTKSAASSPVRQR